MFLHILNEYIWSKPLNEVETSSSHVNPQALAWLMESLQRTDKYGSDAHVWACQMAVAGYILCVCSMSPEPPAERTTKIRGSKGSIIVWKNSLPSHRCERLYRWFEDELSRWTTATDPAVRWDTAKRIIDKVLWLQSDGLFLLRNMLR